MIAELGTYHLRPGQGADLARPLREGEPAILAAMGVAFYAVFAILEARFTGWAQRGAQM
jgi:hypothetical protein